MFLSCYNKIFSRYDYTHPHFFFSCVVFMIGNGKISYHNIKKQLVITINFSYYVAQFCFSFFQLGSIRLEFKMI